MEDYFTFLYHRTWTRGVPTALFSDTFTVYLSWVNTGLNSFTSRTKIVTVALAFLLPEELVSFAITWELSQVKKIIKTEPIGINKSSFENTKTRDLPRTYGTCLFRNPTLPWLQWRHHSKPRSIHHHPQCGSQIGHFHPEIKRCKGNYNHRNDWTLTKSWDNVSYLSSVTAVPLEEDYQPVV